MGQNKVRIDGVEEKTSSTLKRLEREFCDHRSTSKASTKKPTRYVTASLSQSPPGGKGRAPLLWWRERGFIAVIYTVRLIRGNGEAEL